MPKRTLTSMLEQALTLLREAVQRLKRIEEYLAEQSRVRGQAVAVKAEEGR